MRAAPRPAASHIAVLSTADLRTAAVLTAARSASAGGGRAALRAASPPSGATGERTDGRTDGAALRAASGFGLHHAKPTAAKPTAASSTAILFTVGAAVQ